MFRQESYHQCTANVYFMMLNSLSLSLSADESVYVVNAGVRVSVVCVARPGDFKESSLSHHSVHPAA